MVANSQGSNRFVESADELNESKGYNGDLAFVVDKSGETPKISAMYVKNGTWIKILGSENDSTPDDTSDSNDQTNDTLNEEENSDTV